MPRFEHAGISHYYTIIGAGFPMIFIHGLGLNHQNWLGQVPVFKKNFTVITYDVRGHGGTGASQGPIEIKDLSCDLLALCRQLKIEKAFLVAYSSGTLIAEQFALDHPEMVAGLCLAGPYARVHGAQMVMKNSLSKWLINARLHKLMAYSVAQSNAKNVVQRGFFYRIAKRAEPKEALRIMQASERFLTTREVSKIGCPVLLVYGTKDRANEIFAKEFASQMPNAQISVIEGTNHAVATRTCGAFNSILSDFVEQIELPVDPSLHFH
ncbi:pimeloyl-ACP methyl ester carboxylesterase [Tumebacillus sp. BK434]|uniref:alpha/beta fold hydrolase n=1 Tax=Tumebacillus sp. BK434 TaxID=2512169 RepID=UPI0010492855|nr:alpha/beta hydrolase [Tumebacillus sp. BK434]TCP52905.1 pimeloyl-ACP methyl ester carboxylesterase [Tumebacillus sp. BK434]